MDFFFSELDVSNIRGSVILLDIDGTIVPDGEAMPNQGAIKKIVELMKNNRVYLCTNKKIHERNRALAEVSGAHYLETPFRKPSKKILSHLSELSRHTYVVIGDKLITDGLFAKRIGASFIKVRRLTAPRENLIVRLSYWVDDLMAKLFF